MFLQAPVDCVDMGTPSYAIDRTGDSGILDQSVSSSGVGVTNKNGQINTTSESNRGNSETIWVDPPSYVKVSHTTVNMM